MALHRVTITVTDATGGSGTATANSTSTKVVRGWIVGVYLKYTDIPPATSDVTIAGADISPAQAIITVTDANTDGWFHPLHQAQDEDGTDFVGQGVPIIIADRIIVTIAQANNNDGVTATILYED